EGSGVNIKLPGKVEAGGFGPHSQLTGLKPGQLRTRFESTPQFPFNEVKLKLNGGPRAPIANPQACGTAGATGLFVPWSAAPGAELPLTPAAPLSTTGCTGAFNPGFLAQTDNPTAGGSTSFTVRLSRNDGEQDLGGIQVVNPPGLLGKIAGV